MTSSSVGVSGIVKWLEYRTVTFDSILNVGHLP